MNKILGRTAFILACAGIIYCSHNIPKYSSKSESETRDSTYVEQGITSSDDLSKSTRTSDDKIINNTIDDILLPHPIQKDHSLTRKNVKYHEGLFYASLGAPDLGYKEIVKEIDFRGVKLSLSSTKIGRIQRALRWKNISSESENKYGLPKDYLIGMMCVESEGDPTRPNDSGDGGAGVIHMQPSMSKKYGLDMITNSHKLVDRNQGKKIVKTLKDKKRDLKNLIEHDDRWHVIINIDAAARMIADSYVSTGSWDRALRKYAGRKTYGDKVKNYVANINNSNYMKLVKDDFNKRNKGVIINGKQITFDEYIRIFQEQNRNYGLDTYKKMPKYLVKNHMKKSKRK
ncbi:MAG: hypothetical protein ACP5N1_06855 [Candidatus Woesearchaeota archaeon]